MRNRSPTPSRLSQPAGRMLTKSSRFVEMQCLKALAQHIRERLNVTKSCTVFETELERVWPRKRYAASLREKRILSFAKSHGFETIIWDPGIRITFRKVQKS